MTALGRARQGKAGVSRVRPNGFGLDRLASQAWKVIARPVPSRKRTRGSDSSFEEVRVSFIILA